MGPKADPRGTPRLRECFTGVPPSIETYCIRSDRYMQDCNHSRGSPVISKKERAECHDKQYQKQQISYLLS